MSRRQIIYTAVGVLLVGLLVVRLIYKAITRDKDFDAEREWYVKNLHYDFAAEVDTVAIERADRLGPGMVVCKITRGSINYRVEDSLKRELQYYKRLRFNEMRERGYVRFVSRVANRYVPGDCVVVQSDSNKIEIFHNKYRIAKSTLTDILQARGRDVD